jgi:hypothetical protein
LERREKMENPDGAQNRLFVIVAIGLVAVLMIGLLSIAGLVIYTRFLAPAASPTVVAEATLTPTAEAAATPTWSPSPEATRTTGPVPTATRVVSEGSPQPGEATPTPGGAAATATPGGEDEMAPTGFGPLEALLGGVFLALVILFVRRLRMTGQS